MIDFAAAAATAYSTIGTMRIPAAAANMISRLIWLLLCVPILVFAEEQEGPRTGYFRLSMTPIELLGEAGAQGIAEILPPDTNISWQLYVPGDYSPENPPGVVVYVSPYERGGPPRAWNDLLVEHNLIWIGANLAGNKSPVAERMMKAMLATSVLAQSYVIDMERCYIAGFSGGGRTATRIATARPEMFKGGVYMGGTVFWEDNTPPKIELIKQNYHVFMVGTYDPAMKDTQRVYNGYRDAGVDNAELITIRNHRHRMPPTEYFARAIAHLDSRIQPVEPASD